MGNSQGVPQIPFSYSHILNVIIICQESGNVIQMKSYIRLTSVYFLQVGLSIVKNQLSVWW